MILPLNIHFLPQFASASLQQSNSVVPFLLEFLLKAGQLPLLHLNFVVLVGNQALVVAVKLLGFGLSANRRLSEVTSRYCVGSLATRPFTDV